LASVCYRHMKQPALSFEELDDWAVLCTFLPGGWEQKARELGALTRARGVSGPEALLRILLIHIANGCSLAETAVRAQQAGLGQLNQSAVYKRLRSAEEWLRWMAEQMRANLGMATPKIRRRVRAVDATSISEPGSTGTDWRIHYSINLANLQCDFFMLTDVGGGETWRRFPIARGDIMLGDRGYSTPVGVRHVFEAGADVVVRLNRQALPLFNEQGKRLDAVKLARKLKTNESREWPAWVTGGQDKWIPGRLIIVRRSKQAAALALKKLKRRGVRKQITVSVTSLEATKYFFMWTTMPSSWTSQTILDLYRSRWQIELAFKRMKSIMGLGHLPKKDPESCRAWLHGKLFTSLLVELMIGTAKKISPWGYELDTAPEQMA
jgi:Transposase DDE domain